MMNKIFQFRTMLVAMILSITLFDALLWLTGHGQPFPHRSALLTCALIWFASLFFPQNSNDDWAGQF